MNTDDYDFKWVRGEHVEVFKNGVFQFSADSIAEAEQELLSLAENEMVVL